jgi:hypothetical protein
MAGRAYPFGRVTQATDARTWPEPPKSTGRYEARLFPAGPFRWLGVQADNGATRDLGTIDVALETCTWSHTYLACAAEAPGRFVFYRVRTPWYSGRV